MPTALDLLGIAPPAGISGVSLAPLMSGATREIGLDAVLGGDVPLHHYGWSDLHALRSGRYKVIDAPRPELYDVDRDPQEATNLFGDRRQLGDRHDRRARRWNGNSRSPRPPCRPAAWIQKRAQRLAALGYVGIFVATRGGHADRPRRSEGQDRHLQQARRGHRTVEGPWSRRIVVRGDHRAPQRNRPTTIRKSSTRGSCWARSTWRRASSRRPSSTTRRRWRSSRTTTCGLQPRAGVSQHGQRRGRARRI